MRIRTLLIAGILMGLFNIAVLAHADVTPLPPSVVKEAGALEPVGSGIYRKFGFSIYHATLWAPHGKYDPAKPYALQLTYDRSLSQDTMVDAVMTDLRSQNVTNEPELANWKKTLNIALPGVDDGDTIIGLALPGRKSLLFFNGIQSISIDDQKFSKAFFNIWLGQSADAALRAKLLGQAN